MSEQPERNAAERDSRSWVLIASVVFVVLLVVVGTVVLLTRGGSDSDSATTTSPSATPTGIATGATGFGTPEVDSFGRRVDMPNNPNGQPLDQLPAARKPSDPDWLTTAPAGTRDKGGWQRVYGVVVPFSTSDGPTRISDGVPGGYSHTPQGAALAASFVMWESLARPADRRLHEQMVVMTPAELAEFDRLKAAGKVPDRLADAATRYMLAPDAFRIVSWADDLCVLTLATKAEPDKNRTPRWTSSQLAMVWDGAAWKLRLPVDRKVPQETIYSLGGWTQW
ncbi:hypothetical protein ACWELJ_21405 [Nocardia sp. NPDC004582]